MFMQAFAIYMAHLCQHQHCAALEKDPSYITILFWLHPDYSNQPEYAMRSSFCTWQTLDLTASPNHSHFQVFITVQSDISILINSVYNK